jgi:hypothetical protein
MAIKFDKKPAPPWDEVSPGESVEMKTAIGTIDIQHPDKSETHQQEIVKEVLALEALCNVGVQASKTINLGNYNNIKIGVSLHMPCPVGGIEGAYEFTKNWVDTKMAQINQEVLDSQQ